MPDEKKSNGAGRIYLRPSAEITAYLERLAEIGIHGKTPTEVAQNLIGNEIERLIREKLLTLNGRPSRRR